MYRITSDAVANLFFQVNWNSPGVQHADAYAGRHVNFWRDYLPERLREALFRKQAGDQVSLNFPAHELLGKANTPTVQTVPRKIFDLTRVGDAAKMPRLGRFYPKGVLKDMPGIFRANSEPFRCLKVNNGQIQIDMGHPLAHHDVVLNTTVGSVQGKPDERGGTMNDWGAIITQGLGMQSRWQDQPTDFFKNNPFQRSDESTDTLFYQHPRLVQHIDDTAINMLKQIYARFLHKGLYVLDIMSSWQSHIPDNADLARLSGLGLNEAELNRNDALSDYRVQDLNKNMRLPYGQATYDAVLCSLSVEYLVHPHEIFKEVARILKPKGWFVVTFSNRWFEPKAIRIWTELHEFERMGLVLEYFRKDHLFNHLCTYSVRGLERPSYDKYYRQLPYADPVYAVWGRRD